MKRFCNYPLTGGGKIAYRNLLTATLSLVLIASSCNSIEDTPANVSRLQVSVTNTTPESRAIVTGTTLPVDAQIGVTLLDAAGQNYDDTPYANLKYTTANGTDWAISGADAPLLTATDGKAIAYYPWIDGADYTALAVETASQTDYMYSGWVEDINNAAPQANFNMKHGLSAFRVILKKDANYKTDATATTVNIQSDAFVASATMNAVDGTLSAWTGNGDVTVDMDDITLSTSDQYTDIMVVPAEAAGTEATFTVAVTDANSNSKNYTVDVPFTTAMQQGKVYQFSLTLSATGFSVSTVAVTEWGTPIVGGEGTLAPVVTQSGPVVNSAGKANGVYAVTAAGELIAYNDAAVDATCLGVALITDNQRIMIEKTQSYDATNTSFYWGKNLYGKNVAGITEISTGYGYLPKADGTYQSTPNLSSDYTTWTSGGLSDFNGKNNTNAIITAYAEHSVDMNARDMCKVLQTFNAGTYGSNQGFTDWYIPAEGQLALIYLNKTAINEALTAIGGTTFSDSIYWSSSEYSSNSGWNVYFNTGCVGYYGKDDDYRVRFVRDI